MEQTFDNVIEDVRVSFADLLKNIQEKHSIEMEQLRTELQANHDQQIDILRISYQLEINRRDEEMNNIKNQHQLELLELIKQAEGVSNQIIETTVEPAFSANVMVRIESNIDDSRYSPKHHLKRFRPTSNAELLNRALNLDRDFDNSDLRKCDYNKSMSYSYKFQSKIRTTRSQKMQCLHSGCDKVFTAKSDLKRHMRKHDATFACLLPNCGKLFSRCEHMKEHFNIHSMM